MAKYSFEFKLKIVQDYLSGQGGTLFLAKKYGFKNSSQIRKWINAYKELGEEGLLRSQKSKNYSVQFKLDAIELYLTTEFVLSRSSQSSQNEQSTIDCELA